MSDGWNREGRDMTKEEDDGTMDLGAHFVFFLGFRTLDRPVRGYESASAARRSGCRRVRHRGVHRWAHERVGA